jgi:Flp pilus assembly protein TadB
MEKKLKGAKMANKTSSTTEINPHMERRAAEKARDRASNAKWNLEIAVFLFAVLIMVIILATYTRAGLEIVASVAVLGLAMVWAVGWRRGKQLYQRFYDEEITKMEEELKKVLEVEAAVKETVEETIEEKVQKALRQRWR